MNLTRLGTFGAIAIVGGLVLAGCSSTPSTPTDSGAPSSAAPSSAPSGLDAIDPSLTGTITAGGSSAQANAETAWTTAFNSVATSVTINYDKSQGSGGGRTNFISGAYDFAGSDAPLSADETTQAAATYPSGAVDLPIYLDGVAVAYNSALGSSLNLTTPTIAKIFSGKITDWSDPAITADNGSALPAGPITVVVRSDSSGTAQNFTNFLNAVDPSDWSYPGSGTFPAAITGTDAQKGGGAVATEIAKIPGAIGYLDHSALATGISAAKVNGIAFSADGVAKAYTDGAGVQSNGVAGDLSIVFDYSKITADSSAYPIPLLSYAIIPLQFKDTANAKATVAYLQFVASADGQKAAATKAGSIPLPQSILDQVAATLATVK